MVAIRLAVNDKKEIIIKRINLSRFSFHGFGSFIWSVKPEEISISQEALDLLETRIGHQYTSMGDLAGLDLSHNTEARDHRCRGFNLNYGFLGYELEVPLEDVLIDRKFHEMLQRSAIEEREYEVGAEDKQQWDELIRLENAGDSKQSEQIYKTIYQKEFFP